MDNSLNDLYKILRESQNKYVYFLLAIAGAMIGLAVQQTSGIGISGSQSALALAILCWGISFFFGCRHIAYVNSCMYTNIHILKASKGQHPELEGKSLDHVQAAIEGMLMAFNSNAEKANNFAKWQFIFLIMGAICYLSWHIFEMYLKTLL